MQGGKRAFGLFKFCRMNPTTKYRTEQMPSLIPKYLVGKIISIKYLNVEWKNFVKKSVTCAGWVRSVRVSNKMLFIDLLDGTSPLSIQLVIQRTHPQWETYNTIKKGFSIKVIGVISTREDVEGKNNIKFQMVINDGSSIEIVGRCDSANYILSSKNMKMATLREHLQFRAKTLSISTIARIRNTLSFDTHNFFQQNGFVYLQTPIITASDCEGAGEMFQVTTLFNKKEVPRDSAGKVDYTKDFFKQQANLTVSGQLAAEAFCCGMSKVYTFGPTFRAQVSNTTKHVAEFWMVEPEIAFADLEDVMDLAQAYIRYCVESVIRKNVQDYVYLESSGTRMGLAERLREKVQTFQTISYTEAIACLEKHNSQFESKLSWGCDLATEHERYLCEKITKCPTFVYNYPQDIKSFYMRLNDDGKTVASFDLLVPGIGEVIGGSQREQRLDVLSKRMDTCGIEKKKYEWYLDLRRYGSVPHSGFGVGFDRLTMFCTETENIRDVIPFPRTPGNADC